MDERGVQYTDTKDKKGSRKTDRHFKNKIKKDNFVFLKNVWVDVRKFFAVGDWISLGVVSIICIVLFVFIVFTARYKTAQVEIVASHERFLYPLHSSVSVNFDGPVGVTNVKIANGMVDVMSSPGRQQICVDASPISKSGQWLACLPNKVFIRIFGKTQGSSSVTTLDGIAR